MAATATTPGKVLEDLPEPAGESLPRQPETKEERPDVEFVDPPPEDLRCPLCLLALHDPTLTSCGHHFCRACIDRVIALKRVCPLCNNDGFHTFLDKNTGRKINALKVNCRLKSRGCQWVGELGRLDCHLDVVNGDCGFVKVECEFGLVGCTTKVFRKDLAEHRRERVHTHLTLMSRFSLLTIEQLEGKLRAEAKERAELERSVEQLKEDRVKLEVKVQEERVKFEEQLQEQQLGFEARLQGLERELREGLKQQHHQIAEIKTELNGDVAKLDRQLIEVSACLGVTTFPFEFTLPNFSEYKATEKEWRSPPFYSHPQGYSFCIGVYPNGLDSCRGSYVSLAVYKVRGDHGDRLKWPRETRITIQLFDQATGNWEQEYVDGRHVVRSRPSSPLECSSMHGEYIHHKNLRPYLYNDCLRLRVKSVVVC